MGGEGSDEGGGEGGPPGVLGEHLPLLQLLMQDLESFVSLQLVLHLLVLHLLVLHLPLQHLLVLCLCVLHLIVLQGCQLGTVPPYANSRLFPAITFVSLQLELHLLMVHLLMVHLPMVHLHVLHLLAMHLIGLQLVQCIDTPTVVFRLQLIMHHCKPLGGSKQELEESKCDEEKNSWRHPCLGQQHP